MATKLRTRGHRVVLNRSAGGDTGITIALTIMGLFMFDQKKNKQFSIL